MEIVVKGRNSEISDRFREHVIEKLQRIDKYDQRKQIHRVEVEVTHERNPRQHDRAARVEMTLRSRGPAVRAEAAAIDQASALDAALDKLVARLRRMRDRHRIHHGQHNPRSLSKAAAYVLDDVVSAGLSDAELAVRTVAGVKVEGDDCPLVVREKTHEAIPMTLEQALHEMELVGHDFYLFVEKDSMRPSVVYVRRAYDYGVIHLDVAD
ncbi:MAG: ribosome hibernation-promoting factor, HPF/YfiA family [Aeromicrobium sp.]